MGIEDKNRRLGRILKKYGKLLVAFSGGVDSAFLLKRAREELGEGAMGVTAVSRIFPKWESVFAVDFAKKIGVRHFVVQAGVMDIPQFTANSKDRCYICKRHLFEMFLKVSDAQGVARVAHGAILDDLEDYRPGQKAAQELGIIAPLLKAGLGKDEVRTLSRRMGLETWNAPQMACLATRIPTGDRISEGRLNMIHMAEELLRREGFTECRMRVHGRVGRIEVDARSIERLVASGLRERITPALLNMGFSHVSVDLRGYVSGSMNP